MSVDMNLLAQVTQFIYREARFQDDNDYDAWEALWADDGVYWIPANGDDIDPEKEMSIVYDNRSRIALRIRQFHTGKRHTQAPQSRLGRVVSNVELVKIEGEDIHVRSNALVFESNLRGDTLWAARNDYVLRRHGDDFRMARKTVKLVNNDKALHTMSFLI